MSFELTSGIDQSSWVDTKVFMNNDTQFCLQDGVQDVAFLFQVVCFGHFFGGGCSCVTSPGIWCLQGAHRDVNVC